MTSTGAGIVYVGRVLKTTQLRKNELMLECESCDDEHRRSRIYHSGFLWPQDNDIIRCVVDDVNGVMRVRQNSVCITANYTRDSFKGMITRSQYKHRKGNKDAPLATSNELSACLLRNHNDDLTNVIEGLNDNTLMECCGRHKRECGILRQWWLKNQIKRQLYCCGMTKTMINACRKFYFKSDHEMLTQLRASPLSLIPLDRSVCIDACRRFGLKVTSTQLNHFEVAKYIYNAYTEHEHTFVYKQHLESVSFRARTKSIDTKFEIDYDTLKSFYGMCTSDTKIIMRSILELQRETAQQVASIAACDRSFSHINLKYVNSAVTSQQSSAIESAFQNPITCIEGPAGCGKTSYVIINILSSIIASFPHIRNGMLVVSPTGKAASKLRTEIQKAGIVAEVFTMHKAMTGKIVSNYKPPTLDRETHFQYVIIDEASMVSTVTLNSFLRIYGTRFRLVMIGDRNQTRPIQPGSVFNEMMESKSPQISCHTLTEIHRTDNAELLTMLRRIIDHQPLQPSSVLTIHSGKDLAKCIQDIYRREIVVDKDLESIKIITPYNAQVDIINSHCIDIRQADVIANMNNLDEEETCFVDHMNREWRVGDIVMFTRNNYDREVNNGEEGVVDGFDETSIRVLCNGVMKKVLKVPRQEEEADEDDDYEMNELVSAHDDIHVEEMVHAYAITIDKSQGSEYRCVVVQVPFMDSRDFLDHKRIYTAFSRAKSHCHFIGSLSVLNSIIMRIPESKNDDLRNLIFTRCSSLCTR